MIRINTLYQEDCKITMSRMNDNLIDLTITSPPYDNLRDYHRYVFDFEGIAKELFRVTKQGGVVVWVVDDSIINKSKSLSSFKQCIYFKEIGFTIHDVMIWNKSAFSSIGNLKSRYAQVFEYMFILSKGPPKTHNLIKDKRNICKNKTYRRSKRQKDGTVKKQEGFKGTIAKYGIRHNIWNINAEMSSLNRVHPAIFPEQLAKDHIRSWSNEGDVVYDPMSGGGTTLKMSIILGRKWIGSEISKEYCDIIQNRIKNVKKLETLI